MIVMGGDGVTEFEITEGDDGVKGTITMNADMTVANMQEIADALMNAMGKVERLELDLSRVGVTDVSGLQVICSAHRSSIELGSRLGISADMSGPFRAAAEGAGFLRPKECRFEKENNCLWLTGGSDG